jgi:hypothetical protein
MYRPVKPVWTSPLDTTDKRPRFAGAMFAAREKFEAYADDGVELKAKIKKAKVMLYWKPV